jgi:nucleoside-diphosphate-sugar epimerase
LTDFPLVVITGASGWLGGRVAAALTKGLPEAGEIGRGGSRIRCLIGPEERTDQLRALGAELCVGDLRDPDARRALLRKVDGALLLHIAGVIHPPGRTRLFEEVNHLATRDLVRAASAAGVRRIVAMSSNSPFGSNASPSDTFNEESPYHPYMGYGHSKWRMELALKAAMAEPGAPEIVILRAPWFYGPEQPPRQTLFFSMVRDGRFPLMGDGSQRRSMGYVDSLAAGVLLAAASPRARGRAYWLADERPYPMREIVTTVKATLRDDFGIPVKDDDLRLPSFVSDAARLVDRGLQSAGFYHQKIHVLSEMNLTIACDIARAREELGYRPLVELREGMRRSIQWCLSQGHGLGVPPCGSSKKVNVISSSGR